MWLPDHAPLRVTSVSGKSRRDKVVAASSPASLCGGIKNQAAAVLQASSSLSTPNCCKQQIPSTFGSEDICSHNLPTRSVAPAAIHRVAVAPLYYQNGRTRSCPRPARRTSRLQHHRAGSYSLQYVAHRPRDAVALLTCLQLSMPTSPGCRRASPSCSSLPSGPSWLSHISS